MQMQRTALDHQQGTAPQKGRGTRGQRLGTPQRSHRHSERADGRHTRTPRATHSATRRAGRTAAKQLKPRPQAAPQVGLAQAADARPDGQLAQALLPASARKTRPMRWAGDVVRQRKRQRGGAGAPPKKPKTEKTHAAKGKERGELGGRLHGSTADAHDPHCARRKTRRTSQKATSSRRRMSPRRSAPS